MDSSSTTPSSTTQCLSIDDAIDAELDARRALSELHARFALDEPGPDTELPLSVRIADEITTRVAGPSPWLNRYRKASRGLF